MSTTQERIRQLVQLVCRVLLRPMIVLTVSVLIFVYVFGNDVRMKQTLRSSGIYRNIVNSFIDTNAKSNSETSIPLDAPEVKEAIQDSFTPQFMQQNSEAVLDSIYAWLKGTTSEVEFAVDIQPNKDMLTTRLSQYATGQLAFKPDCKVQPEVFDPFTTDCRPQGINLLEGEAQLKEIIYNSDGFFNKTQFSADDIAPKNGKNIFEQYSFVPLLYRITVLSTWPLVALSLSITLGAVGLSKKKRVAWQWVAWRYISMGIGMLAIPLLFVYILPLMYGKNPLTISASNSIEGVFDEVINTFVSRIDKLLLFAGTIITMIGAMVWAGERMTRARSKYHNVEKKSGVVSSIQKLKKPSQSKNKLRPESVPLQSSEYKVKNTAKKVNTASKKYSKLPLERSE